jgi:hypothetical protein
MENQKQFPLAAKFSKICMNDCKSKADCKICDQVYGMGKVSLTNCVCETKSTCAICDQMCNLDTKLFDIVLRHSKNKSKDSNASEKDLNERDSNVSKEKGSNVSVRYSKEVIGTSNSATSQSEAEKSTESTSKASRKSCMSMHVCEVCVKTSEFLAACESFAFCPACQKPQCDDTETIPCTSKDTCNLCSSSNPQLRFREILDQMKTAKVESIVEINSF